MKGDTRVAGVVREKTGYLMNSELQGDSCYSNSITG